MSFYNTPSDNQNDATDKPKRTALVLVPPAMPTAAEISDVLANAKQAPLADLLGPSFGARLADDERFAALAAGVSNGTSVTGFVGGDDYLLIEELKVIASDLGLTPSRFDVKAWKKALFTLQKRFGCLRSKRKKAAVQAAKALLNAPQAAE